MSIRQRQHAVVSPSLLAGSRADTTDADTPSPATTPPDPGDGMSTCPLCKGGKTIKDGNVTCPQCKGKGQVPTDSLSGNALPVAGEIRGVTMSAMPPAGA